MPDPTEPMKPGDFTQALWGRRWRVLALVVAVAAAGVFGPRILLGPQVAVDTVVPRELVQTVVASGYVQTPYRADIAAQITGIVADVPVEEGETVKAEQPLVLLDDKDLRAAVDQATSAVALTRARIRQIDEVALPAAAEALKQSQANLVNVRKTFDRTAQLHANGNATTAQFDEAKRNLDVALAQLRSARLQVETNRPGGSDYTLAQHALTQAEANLRSTQTRLAYAVIRAPRDGTLISRKVERGYVVQPGQTLMTLSPAGETQLVLQIDEKNLGLIAIGQKAIASTDAYPNQTFPAEVFYMNPAVNAQSAAVEVKLRVAPADVPSYLRQDMTVSVDIEVARKQDALAVPIQDVHDAASATPWVLKVNGGRARKQVIKLGLRGTTLVEIAEGLRAGDRVVPWDVNVVDGQRIRAVFRE